MAVYHHTLSTLIISAAVLTQYKKRPTELFWFALIIHIFVLTNEKQVKFVIYVHMLSGDNS